MILFCLVVFLVIDREFFEKYIGVIKGWIIVLNCLVFGFLFLNIIWYKGGFFLVFDLWMEFLIGGL